jgi:hypothetical protein
LQLVHFQQIDSLPALAEGTLCPLQAQPPFSLCLFRWYRVATGNALSLTVSGNKIKETA